MYRLGRVDVVVSLLRVATLACFLASMATFHALAREPVFRDFAWGDPIPSFTEGTPAWGESYPGVVVLRQRDEVGSLGSLVLDPLRGVEYHYFQERLMRIDVRLLGESDDTFDATKRMLRVKYGEPVVDLGEVARWEVGDTTVDLARLDGGQTWFSLASKPLVQEYKAWLEAYLNEEAKKNAESW